MNSPLSRPRPNFCRADLLAVLIMALALLVVAPHADSFASTQPAHTRGAIVKAESKDGWGKTAQQTAALIDEATKAFEAGDTEGARAKANKARYDVYQGKGLDKQISAKLSGSDANQIDLNFSLLIHAIKTDDKAQVADSAAEIKDKLESSAQKLSGADQAAPQEVSKGKWGQVASTMIGILDEAKDIMKKGDAQAAKDKVNEAYYGHYETTGFEKVTMARVSGGRVSEIELEFSLIKQDMTDGNSDSALQRIDELEPKLVEDANKLDGFDPESGAEGGSSSTTIFLSSLLVILREGVEAILVVAAVIAYLVRAGHKDKTRTVWYGAGAALILSIIMAIVLSKITALAGKSQELVEGITALFAVAMLIYVSNWMLGKSHQSAWGQYIKSKTDFSLSTGSLWSLSFVAFLAVLREGAETILFYQPILAMAGDDKHWVWIGLAIGAVCLVVIYTAIQLLSIRIPLRPFFIVTSLLLAVMAVTFTGSGIKELQEADVLRATPVNGFPTIDLLGVYPRVENLIAQAVVLLIIISLFIYARSKNKRLDSADAK